MNELEYYAVNDRPVKVVEFEDGSADILVYEWSTGGFIPDRSFWEHIHGGNVFKDTDRLTKEQFDELVGSLRTRAVAKHMKTPITWQRSGDEHTPLLAQLASHTFTILTKSLATEPRYTLLIDGEYIADLQDWPSAWSRPETPGIR